jgi:hypothetical protein
MIGTGPAAAALRKRPAPHPPPRRPSQVRLPRGVVATYSVFGMSAARGAAPSTGVQTARITLATL